MVQLICATDPKRTRENVVSFAWMIFAALLALVLLYVGIRVLAGVAASAGDTAGRVVGGGALLAFGLSVAVRYGKLIAAVVRDGDYKRMR